MAFYDIFFKGGEITASQQLHASYLETADVASPWSDNSHLEQITIASLYGLTPDTLPVNRSTAMQIAAVAKGRNLICSSIARMPLKVIRNGSPLASQPTFLTQMQVGIPNFITMSWIIDALLFYGRSFLLITERDATGKPLHLRFVPESKAETKDGELVRAFDQSVAKGSYIRIDAFSEGFLTYGREVLIEAREVELAAREAGANPVPSIVLKQREGADLDQTSIEKLLAGWTSARRKRGGSVAFANKSVDVESLGKHAEDLLIAGRNQAVLQVARAMGLPAYELSANVEGTSLNYSNMADRNRQLIDALTPYIEAIQGTLSLYLPAGQTVKFDATELLKADTKERYDYYRTAIEAGFLTEDEVRERENLEPLTDEQRALKTPPALPAPQSNPTETEAPE